VIEKPALNLLTCTTPDNLKFPDGSRHSSAHSACYVLLISCPY